MRDPSIADKVEPPADGLGQKMAAAGSWRGRNFVVEITDVKTGKITACRECAEIYRNGGNYTLVQDKRETVLPVGSVSILVKTYSHM